MKYRTHIIFAVLTVVVTVWLSAPVDQGYVVPAWRLGQMLSPYHPPQWSADGEFVAFTHEQVLYVVGSDGSGLRRLTGVGDVGRAPNTSPVDAHIAYTAGKHGGWFPWPNRYRLDIVTSALDGSDRRRLTKSDNPRVEYLNPVWSPDGTRIAFSSNRTGREEPESRQEASGPFATYTMASDGSDVRGIAPGMPARRMAWSPDGRRLALVANQISGALYTVGADGSGLTGLGETGGLPGWSPDGSRLAFVRREGDAEAVVTVAPDGSNVTKVLGHRDLFTLSFRDVSWSPDGTRILVSGRLAGDGAVIVVVNADGSDPRRLFAMPSKHALDLAASWSPDGSRIAIYSREPQFTDGLLVTMANDGSDARILVKYTRNSRVFEAGHGAAFSWFEPTESELVRNWNEWRMRQAITPEEVGWESWRQWGRWPRVSAQGLRKTRQGETFDVSAVETWIRTHSSTTTVEIIPMKYDPEDLWRWATILDRFAASPGNTIEMMGAEVDKHVRREGVYLNRPSRGEDFGFETAPKTIRVKGREPRRLVVALPVLLPLLGIPVDAVGLVEACPRRGYCP